MQRRFFTQALSLGAISLPLPLALVGCGGSEPVPLASTSGQTAPAAAPKAAKTAVAQLPAALPASAFERVLVGPDGTIYTLNRQAKTLSSVKAQFSVASAAPATLASVEKGAALSSPTNPTDASFDDAGNVYVLDKSTPEVRVYSSSGVLLRQFGRYGAGPDGLSSPTALAVYQDRVFIADSANHRVQVFSTAGLALSRFGDLQTHGTKQTKGEGFNYPKDIKVSGDGHIYVLQGGTSVVTSYTDAGVLVETFEFAAPANGKKHHFNAIALSPTGLLYATDATHNSIYTVAKDGTSSVQATHLLANGKPAAARHISVGADEKLHLSGARAVKG